MITLSSGHTINPANITYVQPASWSEARGAGVTWVEIKCTGLDVHFIGGNALRLPEPSATELLTALRARN